MAYTSEPKFRVAICGGGIGGLFLAITIGKHDPSIPVDIYEAHDSIGAVGVGISLWKQVHEVLIELGLFDDFKQIITSYESNRSPKFRRSDIPEGGYVWWDMPEVTSSMHRQQMVSILEKHLPASCNVHLRKRLVDYTELGDQDALSTSGIRLEFVDGTHAMTDILVGADGIRSAVRKTLFEAAASEDDVNQKLDLRDFVDATFTGMLTHRFLISADTLREESPDNRALKEMTAYCGKGRYMITFPIMQNTLVNVVAVVTDRNLAGTRYEGPWVTDSTRDEIVDRFDDFEPDAKAVIKLCEKSSKWALHELKPLPFCVRKRVALIGDACHAMTPFYGAGAGQAIDDAYVLGRLIAHPLVKLPQIPGVLRIYEQIRLRFAQDLAKLSLSTGWMYMFMEPGYYDGARKQENLDENGVSAYERDGIETMRQEMTRRWKWIYASKSGLSMWKEAEFKLRVSVG